jgi:hypothetical protein
MTNSEFLLEGDADDVGAHLLHVARGERAPRAARERALSRVSAAAAGALVVTSAKATLAVPAVAGSAGLLGAKWLVIGLAAALIGLSAADRVAGALSRPETVPVRGVQSALPLVASPPLASATPEVAAPPVDPASSAVAPGSAPPRPVRAVPEPAASASPSLAPSRAAFESASVAQLTREVAALRRARAALAQGKTALALEQLAAYQREFPNGVLGTEEAALRVEIAFARGDDDAPRLAQAFLDRHPTSPLAARLRALLDDERKTTPKP